LRERGREYGTTTGRPRRCGWLDAVAVRTARALSGVGSLAVTKLDVLTGLDEIKIADYYETESGRADWTPQETRDLGRARAHLLSFPGFSENIRGARRLEDLPKNARRYLDALSDLAGAPIGLVSVGPDRGETIVTRDFFAA
jgi:adenylosuccinate synthase